MCCHCCAHKGVHGNPHTRLNAAITREYNQPSPEIEGACRGKPDAAYTLFHFECKRAEVGHERERMPRPNASDGWTGLVVDQLCPGFRSRPAAVSLHKQEQGLGSHHEVE